MKCRVTSTFVRRALLLLLAGAIVNIAVAWICAALPTKPDTIDLLTGVGRHSYLDWSPTWTSKSVSVRTGDIRASEKPKRWLGMPMPSRWFEKGEESSVIPSWSRFSGSRWPLADLRSNGETRDVGYLERASGWPMYALCYEWIRPWSGNPATRNTDDARGLLLVPTNWLPKDFETDWPLRPIWPGFAINTVFYAVILWGLFAAPFTLRRRMRIKRCLCAKCAYDLRGHAGSADATACPECGAPG